MKKQSILLVVLFLLSVSLSYAQITEKGNFVMGSTLGFSTANSEVTLDREGNSIQGKGVRATQVNIAPAIGYFILKGFAIGISMDYTMNRLREPVDISDPNTEYDRENDSNLLFGPFTRFYFPVGVDKAFFLEGTFGFGSSEDQLSIDDTPQTISNDVLAFGFGPGFTIFSNDGIGIEALVKYNWSRSNSNISFDEIVYETTTFTNQLDFSIGFQIYFSRIRPATPDQPERQSERPEKFY